MNLRQPRKKKIGVLVSGGLDSTALIPHYLQENFEVHPVYVQCGLRWEKTEIASAQKFIRALKSPFVFPLLKIRLALDNAYRKNWSQSGKAPGSNSSDAAVFLPARNLLLLTKALLALSDQGIFRVALGTLQGNPFKDARPKFFSSLEKILSDSFDEKIHIETPFKGLSKSIVIRRFSKAPLYLSFSCINPAGRVHCGGCNKCAERKRAFKEAGVKDRTRYKSKT